MWEFCIFFLLANCAKKKWKGILETLLSSLKTKGFFGVRAHNFFHNLHQLLLILHMKCNWEIMQKCALLPRRAINHFLNEPRDFLHRHDCMWIRVSFFHPTMKFFIFSETLHISRFLTLFVYFKGTFEVRTK